MVVGNNKLHYNSVDKTKLYITVVIKFLHVNLTVKGHECRWKPCILSVKNLKSVEIIIIFFY